MQQENQLELYFKGKRGNKFSQLQSSLGKVSKGVDNWQSEYNMTLAKMATSVELNALAMDMLDDINDQLKKNGQVLWFLYDDLDEDLLEKGELRKATLTGLFQLIQASDARRLTSIRFKVFLREDIWSRLVFDNKSHLNGRDIILKWTRKDFLRLALRQAGQSKEFSDLVNRYAPVGEIDQADEDRIDRALQLLWGTRREPNSKSKYVSRWVYDRLTDSSETTFLRSLNILLSEAREYELTTYRNQQISTDRLLLAKSLNAGLDAASRQRCDEVREEYSELVPFFNALVGFNVLASESELREIWQETAEKVIYPFRDFVDFLFSIGLVKLAELKGQEKGCRFADIYIPGFNMSRGRRKY